MDRPLDDPWNTALHMYEIKWRECIKRGHHRINTNLTLPHHCIDCLAEVTGTKRTVGARLRKVTAGGTRIHNPALRRLPIILGVKRPELRNRPIN